MADENGYTNQPCYELYDTTGGTEDWTYYSTGGLGFTFEIGLNGFHPPYARHDRRVRGHARRRPRAHPARAATARPTSRRWRTPRTRARHSVIAGKAPARRNVLRLKKSFKTATSPVIDAQGEEGDRILFDDTLELDHAGARLGQLRAAREPLDAARSGDHAGPGRDRDRPSPPEPARQRCDRRRQPPCPARPAPDLRRQGPSRHRPDGAGVDNSQGHLQGHLGQRRPATTTSRSTRTRDANGSTPATRCSGPPRTADHQLRVGHRGRRRGQPERQAADPAGDQLRRRRALRRHGDLPRPRSRSSPPARRAGA